MSLTHRLSHFLIAALALFFVCAATFGQQKPPTRAPGTSPLPRQDIPKVYAMPGLFPLYPPPPYQFRDNRIVSVIFKTTPEVARRLVPEPLIPNPAGLILVYIGRFNADNYLEAGIGVPVVYPKTKAEGNYAVCLYLDKALPIVAGREVFGYPKKDAEITFDEKEGEITGRVERFGAVLLAITWKRGTEVKPVPKQPLAPWFLQKIIPSASRNAPPDVWQLVSSPFVNVVAKELWTGAATFAFGTSAQDPLGDIKVLEITSAQFTVGDFVMDYGEVIHDYLKK